jgi:hypothetical protein
MIKTDAEKITILILFSYDHLSLLGYRLEYRYEAVYP